MRRSACLPAAVAFALGVLASMAAAHRAAARRLYRHRLAGHRAAGGPDPGGRRDGDDRRGRPARAVSAGRPGAGQRGRGLAVILVVTMFLSDVMNNAATAAVMCPIALGIAAALGVQPRQLS